MPEIESIGIIGYGRFGRLMSHVFREHLPGIRLSVYSRSDESDGELFSSFREVCQSTLLIPSVPIRVFDSVVGEIAELVTPGQIIMDVCSVKMHPREIMLSKLPEGVHVICSHPMFGPSTYRQLGNTLEGLTLVLENARCTDEAFAAVLEVFVSLQLNIVQMDALEHDRLAARFQFLTLCTASMLRELELTRSQIDTPSAAAMMDFVEMISVDRNLVRDLYEFNPFCKEQFGLLERCFEELRSFLNSTPKEKE